MDLRRVAAALQQMGTWATVAGHSPSKQTRGRLHKEIGFRSAETDIGSPPDPECLYYELLRAMGCLDFQAAALWLRMDALDTHLLLPAMTAKHAIAEFPGWRVCDHRGRPSPAWASDEFGRITPLAGDAVSDARLACIADHGCEGWQVTPQSIAHARDLGLTPDQILDWLNQRITPPVPPLLPMAIRNWTGRETCRLARVYLLQVSRPQVRDAILHSPAFAPLLAGHIPPDWFILRDDGIAAARILLKTLGFALSDTLQLGPPAASRAEPPSATGRRKGPRKR